MRLVLAMLAAAVTGVLGYGIYHFPAMPFLISVTPLAFTAGSLAYKGEKE